ncbi:MAG: response regulator transcription factor [Saprospiraceae bacterium]|nr:response regulator transcription factor [Saprospiraceae bacterium]
MIRAIIVDDERESLEVLKLDLQEYCPQVEVLAMCNDPYDAIEKIKRLNPDLIFLDIEMPGLNGFDLLDRLNHYDFDVIFVTAYDEFAIKAIKVSAMDYLLKPIDEEELMDAVHKVEEKQNRYLSKEHVEILMTNLKDTEGRFAKLAIPSLEGLDFILIDDILYCKADGNYTIIHTKDEKFIISKTLKMIEHLLENAPFFRTHQSYLVNVNHIRKYLRGVGGELILSDGSNIQVARARKEALMKRIYHQ